jgi:hypothetical protein
MNVRKKVFIVDTEYNNNKKKSNILTMKNIFFHMFVIVFFRIKYFV